MRGDDSRAVAEMALHLTPLRSALQALAQRGTAQLRPSFEAGKALALLLERMLQSLASNLEAPPPTWHLGVAAGGSGSSLSPRAKIILGSCLSMIIFPKILFQLLREARSAS